MLNGWTPDTVLRMIIAAIGLASAILNFILARRRK